MEKIFITGASGFVGGFLVEEALNRGLEVYAAVRESSNKQYLKDPRIKFVIVDFENQASLENICERNQFDYIIHNAGLTKSPSYEKLEKVNSQYLENLYQASFQCTSLKKFTFISSLAAYGPGDNKEEEVVSDTSIPRPVTNYGRSKLAGEEFLKKQDKTPWIIIRPTAVYGPREWDLFTVYDLMNKGLELSVGLDQQKLTFIYVKDLARVIIDATLSEKINLAYFASDLKVYSTEQYYNAVKKALGKRTFKIKLPISLVKVLAFISEKAGKLTGKYPPLNVDKVNELKARNWACDSRPLVVDFDFKPEFSLERGLEESIEWYRTKNLLK